MEMASEAEEPAGYVKEEEDLALETPASSEKRHGRRRIATVYDAVAGNTTRRKPETLQRHSLTLSRSDIKQGS